jgi:NADH-quinone oxidoreductase subunit M
LLVALIALRLRTGSFDLPGMMGAGLPLGEQVWLFLAMAISFAIKVPMLPFHTWLPAAHVEAPTAGSVLLAGVLLKMGGYGFLRFCLPMTPDASVLFAPWMVGLSVAAIVYGGFAALAQTDLKKLVAYSSVGHMGFVTLGIFSLNRQGVEGAILQMINHGITTGALFVAVGMLYERLHTRELDAAAGAGGRMPIWATCFGLFALSSLAFPGTNSFIGEFLVLAGGFEFSRVLTACAVPGVVLAAAYNFRMLQRVAFGGTKNPGHEGLRDIGFREACALVPMAAFILWIGLAPAPFTRVLHAGVGHLLEQVHGAPAPSPGTRIP